MLPSITYRIFNWNYSHFLQEYTAKGRYTIAPASRPDSSAMSGHDMSGDKGTTSTVEDMREKTQIGIVRF